MDEFRRLDYETQQKWRAAHQRANKKEQEEAKKNYEEILFLALFLPTKKITEEEFYLLDRQNQEKIIKEFKLWKKQNK